MVITLSNIHHVSQIFHNFGWQKSVIMRFDPERYQIYIDGVIRGVIFYICGFLNLILYMAALNQQVNIIHVENSVETVENNLTSLTKMPSEMLETVFTLFIFRHYVKLQIVYIQNPTCFYL